MAKTDNKSVMVKPSEDVLAELNQTMPSEPGYSRTNFPRISFVGKDETETVTNKKTGKKEIKIITEAGTFIQEVYNKETKEYEKTELGLEIDILTVYQRKQLKHYDESSKSYTSSPIYDTDEDIVPLFENKKVIERGTPEELRSKARFTEMKDGKKKSTLEEQKVLYVMFEGEMHELTVRGSSGWNFSKYRREVPNISAVVTTISSVQETTGSNTYNKMTFSVKRDITNDEALELLANRRDIISGIEAEKAYFSKFQVADEGEKVDITAEFQVKGKGMDTNLLADGAEM